MPPVWLWLDDTRPAPPGWKHARTASEAMEILAGGEVDRISLDDHLGAPEAGTSSDVVRWLEEQAAGGTWWLLPRFCGCHGTDPVERARIAELFASAWKERDRHQPCFYPDPPRVWVDREVPPTSGGWVWARSFSEAVAEIGSEWPSGFAKRRLISFGDSLGPWKEERPSEVAEAIARGPYPYSPLEWTYHGEDEEEGARVRAHMAIADEQWREPEGRWGWDNQDRVIDVWNTIAFLPVDEFRERYAEALRTEHPDVVNDLKEEFWPAEHDRTLPEEHPPRLPYDPRWSPPHGIEPERACDVTFKLFQDERRRWWAKCRSLWIAVPGANPAEVVQRAQAVALRLLAVSVDREPVWTPFRAITFVFDGDAGRDITWLPDDDPRVEVRKLRDGVRAVWRPDLDEEDLPWEGGEESVARGRAFAVQAASAVVRALGEVPETDWSGLTRQFIDHESFLPGGAGRLPRDLRWLLAVPAPGDEVDVCLGESFATRLDQFMWDCTDAKARIRGGGSGGGEAG